MKKDQVGASFSVFFFWALLFSQSVSQAKIETTLGDQALATNPNLALPLPTTASPEIILSRKQYVISYNKINRSPNWVAWKLESADLGKSGRTNGFAQDTELENYLARTHGSPAVEPAEYTGSCFDRGHQIPSADRTDNVGDNQATFLMSNMIPQTPYLNRVVWEHLESYTRNLIKTGDKKVYVIAGPIFDLDFGSVGPHADIPVPSKDFKIILVVDAHPILGGATTQIIAVVMPNVRQDGSPQAIGQACESLTQRLPENINDWQKYQTTLAEIERLSGISFALPE